MSTGTAVLVLLGGVLGAMFWVVWWLGRVWSATRELVRLVRVARSRERVRDVSTDERLDTLAASVDKLVAALVGYVTTPGLLPRVPMPEEPVSPVRPYAPTVEYRETKFTDDGGEDDVWAASGWPPAAPAPQWRPFESSGSF